MSSATPPPPVPDDHLFDLSDQEVRRLQKILNSEGGYQYSKIEAKYRGLELLQLFRTLLDPKADEERRRHFESGPKMVPRPPSPPPEPEAFPIRLDADHAYEVGSNLRMLEYELGRAKQFPSSWRWAVVATYNALGHALMLRHPAGPKDPLHHLLELFDAATRGKPLIRRSRQSVEQLELIRTAWLPRMMSDWPVTQAQLPQVIRACRETIESLRGDLTS